MQAMNKIVISAAMRNQIPVIPVFRSGHEKTDEKNQAIALQWSKLGDTMNYSSYSDDDDDDDLGDDDLGEFSELYIEDKKELTQVHQKPLQNKYTKEQFERLKQSWISLHGLSLFGEVETKDVHVIRLALIPSNIMDDVQCQIYQIDPKKNLIIEMLFEPVTLLRSENPPQVRLFQALPSMNLSSFNIITTDFGLQWFLQKRLEAFLRKAWTTNPTSSLFVDIVIEAIDKITKCSKVCMICDDPLTFSMLKPTICDKPLCHFSYDEFGLGVDPISEIHLHPETVDLLISFTYAAAIGGDVRRFTPFPKNVEATWKDATGQPCTARFIKDVKAEPTNQDLTIIRKVMDAFPSVEDMSKFNSTAQLKRDLDSRDRLAFPLLRWILTSNRAHIALLSPAERIKGIGTQLQFLMLSSPPSKEKQFSAEKKIKGSIMTYHGSGWGNWHSIVRGGLKNLSGTTLMSTGQAYGAGIYLAKDSSTSVGYAKSGSSWPKSKMGSIGLQCLSLCELINNNYIPNPYYVVANEDHIVTRYIFVYNAANTHVSNTASTLVIPSTNYGKYQQG
eukprot:TRINITY_DN3918_c0_g1_i2.p1 TRINITY_DN3918_c0_g1~~TRINITY_DN3918_c0_g1_i2.p1  ORF type:complete len:560 (-),score=88.31 TRINITY_DN3918_c0_g1_i2:72-1751(-)